MAFDKKKWRDEWKAANPDKVAEQLARDAARRKITRRTETPEKREERLAKHRERHKRWRDANPEKVRAYVRADRLKNMDRIRRQGRDRALQVKYELTLPEYETMLAAQNHRCAICDTDKAVVRRSHYSWRVDHCHDTGKVRALLCHNCNIALGLLKENVQTLEAMIKYLKHHGNT